MNDRRSPFPFFSASSISRTECRYGTFTSDVHVAAGSPLAAVSDAAAIVGRDHDVPFLQEILVKAVVNGVIPLDVPAVVVLIDAVAMNPDDGRMLLAAIEILGNEEPRRH